MKRQTLAFIIGATNPATGHVYIDGQDACLDIADAIIASGIIPEPRTIEEWGVRGGPSGREDGVASSCTDPGGTYRRYDEALARYDTAHRPGDLRRRVRTSYPDKMTEWEVVE